MVEGLDVYKEILDDLKYLTVFSNLYPAHKDYLSVPKKFQQSARNHYARALDCRDVVEKDLENLKKECLEFSKFLKSENLVTILDLEDDLELIYKDINCRFLKIFDAFSMLAEEVKYLKEAENRKANSRKKSAR